MILCHVLKAISFSRESCVILQTKKDYIITVVFFTFSGIFLGSIYGDRVGQMAIIARSNFQLFCEIVKKCCYSEENIKVSFAGVCISLLHLLPLCETAIGVYITIYIYCFFLTEP